MQLYQVNKVEAPMGRVIKTRHVLANSDREAVRTARADNDCPVCEIRLNGRRVGTIT